MKKFEQYQDMIGRLFPELTKKDDDGNKTKTLSRTVTFQVTDKCNLACTYCYQINKGERVMIFEDAKKLIDMLLEGDERLGGYVDVESSPAIIIEFIGGEPFLQVDLIEKICDYFYDKAIEMCHPWATKFCISICSNGVLYFDEKVQKFLNKYRNKMSFSVTIDGNKELHDACRVFHDGRPSYDLAVAAANDWMSKGFYMGSKITIAPGNLDYLYDAILHMVELGYTEINANTVYEKGWTIDHAKQFYQELKRISDYWVDNDLVETHYLSLFSEDFFCPKEEGDDDNWCGGTGSMLSMDPDGYLYPCIRYMESSLGTNIKPLRIGHVDIGIAQTECDKKCVDCLNAITRRTQSTDECYYCPIAAGCSWCFPAGTKINTPDGLKDIQTLQSGDIVIDMYGNEQKIISNYSRKVTKDELTYVKAAGLYDLLCTKEHPFYSMTVDKRHNNYPIYGNPKWVNAGDLKTTDRIALYVPKLGNKDIDKEIAYIIGRYIGDGYKTKSNRKKHPYKYYIVCAFDEDIEIETHLNNANILWNKTKQRTNFAYNINITNNEYLISILDQCGRYAKDKHVPRCVWEWTKESVQSLLQGYFDADGSYDAHKGQRYTSINHELILNVSELVRAVYHANVNIAKRIPSPNCIIEGRVVNQSKSFEGCFKLLENLSRNYYEFDEKSNMMWVNVSSSKKEIPEKIEVYNLNVENTHSYIANGAIVHNCSAYNYQENGTPDKRVTYSCDMHKARSLANVYFWNRYYITKNIDKRFKMHCPEEWALEIIDEDEYKLLKELEKGGL